MALKHFLAGNFPHDTSNRPAPCRPVLPPTGPRASLPTRCLPAPPAAPHLPQPRLEVHLRPLVLRQQRRGAGHQAQVLRQGHGRALRLQGRRAENGRRLTVDGMGLAAMQVHEAWCKLFQLGRNRWLR